LKRTSTLFISLIITLTAFGQEFSGTYVGVMSNDNSPVRRTTRFALQIQQAGRAVWGIYTIGDSMNIKKADCACTISGQLPKKSRTSVSLYKEKVLETTIPDAVCDQLTYLSIGHIEKDGKLYLTGNWFGTQTSLRPDGAAGSISLVKVSDKTAVNVSEYFGNLEKMLKKYNPGDSTYSK
jgi:hypothetical protein